MLPDEELLNRLQLARPPEQIAAAGEKAFAMLSQSPYKDKMGNVGLFLKALASRAPAYPNLIRANLGNQIASGEGLLRLQSLAEAGPAQDDKKLDQIAALRSVHASAWTRGPTTSPCFQPSPYLCYRRETSCRSRSRHS